MSSLRHRTPHGARFCDGCGAALTAPRTFIEYKQLTVLFADVVHSMDIASAVGAERLREIMSDLFDRCTAVVSRYGGTVHQFLGDGVMAVFAPRRRSRTTHCARVCPRSASRTVPGRSPRR